MTIGKRVFDDLYVHISAIEQLDDDEHRDLIKGFITRLPLDSGDSVNVAKINLRTGRISFLEYQDFDEAAFPALLRSWSFDRNPSSSPTYRTYATSLNPPILHRKELLVPRNHPARDEWTRITASAEALGLFDEPRIIGFRLNWERLIARKGYRLVGSEFHPQGNEVTQSELGATDSYGGQIQRHLTALSRNNISAPVQLLLRHGLLEQGTSFFDYGCGRGGDVAALASEGFDSRGWDPHFAADQQIVKADVVNLGFVANVIEDPAERVDAIHKAFSLARRVMSVGVMLYGSESPGRPYGDGFITSRNTFQKYFSQSEVKDYIEQVLHREAFMVAPGIAFVFSDAAAEQRFNAGRYRSTGVAARLLATRIPRVPRDKNNNESLARARRRNRVEQMLSVSRPALDQLWTLALELGRLPESDETPGADRIEEQFGSFKRALRLVSAHYDRTLLAAAAKTRTDDLRLFFAAQQFGKRPSYRSLEPSLQRDVKTFFGDYRAAQTSGLQLLVEAAKVEQLRAAAREASQAGIGYLAEDRALQVHLSLVERLPVVLRAYVACGLVLYNAVSEFQLVKIHVESGKLTLLQYDDFETSPLPLLSKRIKINIRLQDYDVFEYNAPLYPKPLLYWKSRYINEDVPGFAEQLLFDEELEATNSVSDAENGPSPEKLHEILQSKRLLIDSYRLVPSRSIPDLDEQCGANFTYRNLIECGETQSQLGIKNLPLRPETYNALYDLAANILDPVIDYFGAIKLTYGFCTNELAKKINGRIAPNLDQHASCELGRGGKLICTRAGAACDFIVDDENMREVADWIIENLPFDRLYFYAEDRPIHVSFGPQNSRLAYVMVKTASGNIGASPLWHRRHMNIS